MRLFVARLADAEARDAISESVPSVVPDTSLKKAASLLKEHKESPTENSRINGEVIWHDASLSTAVLP